MLDLFWRNVSGATASILTSLVLIVYSGESPAQVARIEYYPVQSVTLTDTQFLQGKKDGPAVALAGELRIPKLGSNRLPAVILVHGSGGIGGTGGNDDEWSNKLNALGIATFAIDSFSSRGIVQTATNQDLLGRLAMIPDVYRALELLSKHPQIDPARIALMGFSRGGQVTLYASVKRFQQMYGPANGSEFAAYVAFYPDCSTVYRDDDVVSAKPILVLHGSADDYNPAARCKSIVERITRKGGDIRQIVYEGAHHAFDAPALKQPIKLMQATTTRRCEVFETDNGSLLNRETQQPFTYNDACVEKGPTIAYDTAAAVQAEAFVSDFLNGILSAKN
jgi:dienelactone hydrolase